MVERKIKIGQLVDGNECAKAEDNTLDSQNEM